MMRKDLVSFDENKAETILSKFYEYFNENKCLKSKILIV